jgi:hypothetical protein
MTVRQRDDGVIELIGACPLEDAETLLSLLSAAPDARVDWRACEAAHTAVVQVLRAAGTTPEGPARGAFLSHLVEPALKER